MGQNKTIEIQKKHKDQKNIEKEAAKIKKKMEQRLFNEKLKYDKLITHQERLIREKYQKKLDRRLSKIANQYERKRIDTKKKILGKEVKKKKQPIGKLKLNAYVIYQYYRKLSLADSKGMVTLADTRAKVKRTDCVSGHVFSKSGNGHMAFLNENVWPITSETNRIQGTAPGIFWAVNVLTIKQLEELKRLSLDKKEKNKIRDHSFYKSMFDKYVEEAKKQEKRLGITDSHYLIKREEKKDCE